MESVEHAEGYCYPYLIKLIHDSIPDFQFDADDNIYTQTENPEVNTIVIKDTKKHKECIIRFATFDPSANSNLTVFKDESVDESLRANLLLAINTLIGMLNLTYSILKKKYPAIIEYTNIQFNDELNIMKLDNNEKSNYTIQIDINDL